MRIAITGGAGQIAYSILFRIANGEMLGKDQPVALHILERKDVVSILEGVVMELNDCAFPLLEEIKIGYEPKEIFRGIDFAILIGAKPRTKGMERKDLLMENAKIFIEQGRALNEVASKETVILVVGNPCNTNCWITMKCAPNIPKKNFHAMTRLDQNRARSLLATKANVHLTEVKGALIWGNHSATQVPDIVNTRIGNKEVREVITDKKWLENEFLATLQKRGAAILSARGNSSAASAANGAIDAIEALHFPTEEGSWYSDCVYSEGNPYGIDEDLIFSFPCRSNGSSDWEIISGFEWDDFLKEKIKLTENELIEERKAVKGMF